MPLPRSTNSRSTKPFECLFADLSGKRPASSGVRHYVMMIVDDISGFGWTCFLKEESDVPAVFAGFWLTFGHRVPHPLWSACAQITVRNSPRVSS